MAAFGGVTRLGGKSGLHKTMVPGNARPERSEGKRHRKQTAFVRLRAHRGQGETVG